MAVSLSLSYSERNDNLVLTLTDTTTWGGANIAFAALTTLTLDTTITGSDGVDTVCAHLDLKTLFPAVKVFPLTCANLGVNGSVATAELPDGIYTFTYIVDVGLASEDSFTESILVEGKVRVAVYEALRTLPVTYNCSECKTKEIMDIIFCYGLLNSMEAAGYVAKNEELVNQLYTLERLITNHSSYTW